MLGLLGLFFATMPIARRRQARLARGRRMIDAGTFEQRMASAGVTQTSARFLWAELKPFYHHPLRPMPDDRLESLIAVDRPEIEALISRFWSAMRGNDERAAGSPLGADPTVAELGRYFDLMAGWSLKGTA